MAPPNQPLILAVDDDPNFLALVVHHLRAWEWASATATNAEELWTTLDARRPEVVLLDVLLGEDDGSRLVSEIRRRAPGLPVIMVTRSSSVEAAVRAMKHGAFDYLTKPLDLERLRVTVAAALELARATGVRDQPAALSSGSGVGRSEGGEGVSGEEEIIGRSTAMRELLEKVGRLAPTDAAALLLGETGTGKELVARAIHRRSRRRDGPFVAVNMAALPGELVESQLFGHVKGAFTGAASAHVGFCEAADGGTLFLDEIAEMDVSLQAKLLRFLQDHRVRRIGEAEARPVDVRVLAATHADPRRLIAEGRLREDLYYRLRVVSLELPPLRERGADVVLLAEYFLRRAAQRHGRAFCKLAADARSRLAAHAWPGNVRELEHAIEEAVVLHESEVLEGGMLADEIGRAFKADGLSGPARASMAWTPRQEAERRGLLEALEASDWSPDIAAERLEISRATVYRRMKKYGLS